MSCLCRIFFHEKNSWDLIGTQTEIRHERFSKFLEDNAKDKEEEGHHHTVFNENIRRYPVDTSDNHEEEKRNKNNQVALHLKSKSDRETIRIAIQNDDFLSRILIEKRLEKIIEAMYLVEVKINEEIIREGETGNHMYVVAEGKFEVKTKKNGVVGSVQAGQVFGELAILYNAKRLATIQAITAGKLWVLDRTVYQKVIRQYYEDELKERVVFLQKIDTFKNVDVKVLEEVARLLEQQYFPTGTKIIKQGDKGDNFYIITAGSVTISDKESGAPTELDKGKCFGELALLKNIPRQATVTANATGAECLVLTKEHFINHFGNVENINKITLIEKSIKPLVPSPNRYQNLKLEEFTRSQIIGEGGFGRVQFLQHKTDRSLVFALKYVKRSQMIAKKQVEHIFNEQQIQLSCDSPFIVKLYKTFKDDSYLYFLMEVCLGGELFVLLHNQKEGRFKENGAKFISACVLEALSFLHERGIIYRDLKPENLLIDKNGYIKLTDFGFAKHLEADERTTTFAGTPEYVAPEILASKAYDKSVDYWAYGILIFELLCGRSPFACPGGDDKDVFSKIERGINKIKFPIYFAPSVKTLIQQLCRSIPEQRLGCQMGGSDQIRKQKWFSNFNWISLRNLQIPSPYKPQLAGDDDLRYLNNIKKKHDVVKPDKTHYFDDF